MAWNLFHGRDKPPGGELYTWRSRLLRTTERSATHVQVNRPLLNEFAGYIDSLDWEVALLQEAPPRWLEPLARASAASGALGLTSRNWLAPVRRAMARRNPDLIASNEGGSNMVLVRSPGAIEAVERVTLAQRPERRSVLMTCVRLPGGEPQAFEEVRQRFGLAGPTAPRAIDHLLVRGLDVVSAPAALPPRGGSCASATAWGCGSPTTRLSRPRSA